MNRNVNGGSMLEGEVVAVAPGTGQYYGYVIGMTRTERDVRCKKNRRNKKMLGIRVARLPYRSGPLGLAAFQNGDEVFDDPGHVFHGGGGAGGDVGGEQDVGQAQEGEV